MRYMYFDETYAIWSLFLIRFYDHLDKDLNVLTEEQIVNHVVANYELAVAHGYDVCMDEGDLSTIKGGSVDG